jgi:hypothetical protein
MLSTVERGVRGPLGKSATLVRFLHFATVFGLIPWRLDSVLRLSELLWIARRTTPVVMALACNIWPIVRPSIPMVRLHHQNLGLNI